MQGLFFCWHTSTQSGASSSPENSGVAEPKEGGQVSCDTAHDLRSTCSYITQEAAPQPGGAGRRGDGGGRRRWSRWRRLRARPRRDLSPPAVQAATRTRLCGRRHERRHEARQRGGGGVARKFGERKSALFDPSVLHLMPRASEPVRKAARSRNLYFGHAPAATRRALQKLGGLGVGGPPPKKILRLRHRYMWRSRLAPVS